MKIKFVNDIILIIVLVMIIFSGIAFLHNMSVFAESNEDVILNSQKELNVSEGEANDIIPEETVDTNEEASNNTDNFNTTAPTREKSSIEEPINDLANTKANTKNGTVFNVGSAGLNLRREPGTKGGSVILVMPENSTLKILGEKSVDGRLWYNVEFNGHAGWAAADYIKINGNDNADNNVKPGSDVNLSQDERERIIWDYLKGKGLSDYVISGIMGNLYAESGLNPRNVENAFEFKYGYNDNSYTEAVDNGTYKNFVNDGAGYGLAQWTYYKFKQELLNRAKAEHLSIGDLNLQLNYLWDWIKQNSSAFQSLTNSNSVKSASDTFLKQYENPNDQSEAALLKRATYGELYFNKYKSGDISQNVENQDNNISGDFFYDSDGKLRYKLSNGLYPKVGFIEKDGRKFFTYGNGYIYTNRHITFGPKIMYYMGSDGSLQIGKFRDNEGKLRYSLSDGNLIGSNGWKEDAGGRYFA
ncbi:MAG: phage tail tip lysozyme, partial [Anaerovoracaceae bacterium]|nr:phage tail tip lysozyme [Anaerovoracaceae bacterium]